MVKGERDGAKRHGGRQRDRDERIHPCSVVVKGPAHRRNVLSSMCGYSHGGDVLWICGVSRPECL